jgi:hypothetical protein
MNDRELLELAAKAFGVTLEFHQEMSGDFPAYPVEGGFREWNPLLRREDADDLAVAVGLRDSLPNDAMQFPDCRRTVVEYAAAIGAAL